MVDAQAAVALSLGYSLGWSGQFERAKARLAIVVPLTLAGIFLLLFLNFHRLTETLIVMLSLPYALVGRVWLMWGMGFNLSVAVAVGSIALAGVAQAGRAFTRADLNAAITVGAVERVRPKIMTVAAVMLGQMPILWATGTGSEVAK